jgi:DNA-binding NtrC family response regulator
MKSILVIDDEIQICESIKMILDYKNYHTDYVTSAEDAKEKLRFNEYHALLLDIQMPRMNGFEFLDWLKKNDYEIPVIVISAYGSLENAVKATKLGAFDFLEKPIDRDKLLVSVRNAVKHGEILRENKRLKKTIENEYEIIGESDAIKKIKEVIERVAPTDSRILITGENGTGKELVARAIREKSKRKDAPFVEVNCAAIPDELIESELFGHVKGAFTNAIKDREGKFEQADGGTLFLDEIGDMSLSAQAKVLRVLEEGKIERVGSNEQIDVDVRVIAATNKNLTDEIAAGNFREDLFHRLNVIPVHVPPLRERREDIPILIEHFNKTLSEKYGYVPKEFTRDAIEKISSQKFSGNIRELKNLIERILIMIPEKKITAKNIEPYLPVDIKKEDNIFDIANSFAEFKEKTEKMFLEKHLKLNNWNISKTAEALGIQRSHLYNKIKKYGLEKEGE